MPKTKYINISCDEVKITPNGSHVVSVELEGFSVDDLLGTIEKDDISEWVEQNIDVEDVYPQSILEKWAESEGYIKPDNK